MSDSDPDPRFRIPRGSSDEEIDSDLASTASDPPPDPQLPDRPTVTAAAATLRAGSLHSDPILDLRDDEKESEADDEADDTALSAVTYAATGRRELSNAAMRAAREVLPADKEMENVGLGGERAKQKDMVAKMLHALGSGDTNVSGLADLKKKVARLSASGKKELSVPVADHVAGRITRGMAYEEVKKEVTEKWKDVVVENRKKQHLVFPLNGENRVGKTSGIAAERFKPGNKYETEIADMLREAGVGDEHGVVKAEENELKEVRVSKEEVLQRKREMARVRSLMFHYEQRMRRIKKIKSRKYRRILKKEKEKVAEQERELLGSDAEEEAIKAERKRVEERMTLRHKNTSKWVRRQLSRGETKRNWNSRAAVEEQLQLHEQLKRRQEGLADESDESDSEGSIGDGATDERLDEELEQLRKETAEEEAAESKKGPKKGLMSMRFMQAAEERQRKQALELLEEMDEENADSSGGNDGDMDAKPQGRRSFAGHTPKVKEHRSEDKKGVQEPVVDDPHAEVDFSLSEDEGGSHTPADEFETGDLKALKQQVIKEYEDDERNGLAKTREGGDLRNGKLGEILMDASLANAGFTTSMKGRLEVNTSDVVERGKCENDDCKEKSQNSEAVGENGGKRSEKCGKDKNSGKKGWSPEIDTGQNLQIEVTKQAQIEEKASKRRKARSEHVEVKIIGVNGGPLEKSDNKSKEPQAKRRKVGFNDTGSHERNGEHGGDTGMTVRAEWMPSENDGKAGKLNEDDLERMKFVAQAFAGAGGADEEEFERMKEAEIEKELPTAKEIGAEVLPGWGTWDGAGMKKRKRKERSESAFARAARERLAAARARAVSKRRDRNLAHVILDEKRAKRAAELTLASVPFPFTRAEQWEMELKTPICKELVTGNGFSQKVRPRVEKKLGAVIEPIQEGTVGDKARKRKFGGDAKECKEERRANGKGGRESRDIGNGRGGRGKKGVIDLRRQKASKRNAARKGLMR